MAVHSMGVVKTPEDTTMAMAGGMGPAASTAALKLVGFRGRMA
jgi:hypothetical protein